MDVAEDQAPSSFAGAVDIADLWRILWCRRAWVCAAFAICVLAASAYVLTTKSQFTASAQLLIDPRGRQIVTKDVNPDSLAADGGVIQVESQARVIGSDTVLIQAIQKLGLDHEPDYGAVKPGILSSVMQRLSGSSDATDPNASVNRALKVLRAHLALKRADREFIVDIIFTAYSADLAAKIADAIAEAYVNDQVQSRARSSTRASEALAAHLDDLRAQVKAAEDKVETYKAAHDLIGTDRQLLSDQQLGDTNAQLNNARAKTAELRVRAEQIDALRRSGLDKGAIPEAVQSTVITQLRASYADLLRRESDMRTRYGDRYPDLIALVAEVRQARSAIGTELERLARSAHSELDRAQKNERALDQSLDSLKKKTIVSGDASVKLRELNAEASTRRALYQSFLSRAEETGEQSGIDTSNTRILSKAVPPDQASWPARGFIMLGALIGGIGLGATLAFLLEFLRPTILSLAHIQHTTGAPLVGVLPSQTQRISGWPSLRRVARPASPQSNALGLALSRLFGPLPELREATTLHTLFVTSVSHDSKARTDVTAGLASVASAFAISVLLIDADFEAGPHDADGFLDVLRGDCSLKTTLNRRNAPGVQRLGVGRADTGAASTLRERTIDDFMQVAAHDFDFIVFDGGALTDNLWAAPLAACVDQILFVAVRGVTPQRDVATASEAISDACGRSISAAILVDPA
ncbi:exopolysaccharide transport family protein [Beijerinckia sp. L45]|uniref:GumC family protein n=1 Tax=Beijerinckia sp. L45 TaxID=1641855 RepID=UPI00131E17AE|nr:exopolysaccharide transport family protein [Beijerinckia sp. L45]